MAERVSRVVLVISQGLNPNVILPFGTTEVAP